MPTAMTRSSPSCPSSRCSASWPSSASSSARPSCSRSRTARRRPRSRTRPTTCSSARRTPPATSPPPVAFDVEPSGSPAAAADPATRPTCSLAADSVLGAEPVAYKNPSGFPRVPPITQFDGGPFQGSNCTLTSGAMLARLAFGIVTSGSTLRTLQDDQDGGTDLNDLNQALWRGYGVSFPTGFLRPDQLKDLLVEGLRRGHPGRVREDPARPAAAEGLPRRPRDLPRRLLPGQPRQGHPGGLLRHRPHRPAALGLRGRLVAVVGGRRVRDGLRRRQPHPGDVGVSAGRRAAAGQGSARRADPARRRRPGADARSPGRARRRRRRRSSSPATARRRRRPSTPRSTAATWAARS